MFNSSQKNGRRYAIFLVLFLVSSISGFLYSQKNFSGSSAILKNAVIAQNPNKDEMIPILLSPEYVSGIFENTFGKSLSSAPGEGRSTYHRPYDPYLLPITQELNRSYVFNSDFFVRESPVTYSNLYSRCLKFVSEDQAFDFFLQKNKISGDIVLNRSSAEILIRNFFPRVSISGAEIEALLQKIFAVEHNHTKAARSLLFSFCTEPGWRYR